MTRLRTLFAAVLALLVLSGCASAFLVDNQVQSFARWTERAGGTAPAVATVPQPPQVYHFERLPSQRQQPTSAGQDELENLTALALAKVGWTRAGAGTPAPWTVQVSAGTQRLPRAPWESPYDFWPGWYGPGFAMPGRDYIVTGKGNIVWLPMPPRFESPYFKREVSIVVRRAATGQVVYETSAGHDGRWNSTSQLWAAMLDAALADFPTPPEGVRQVNIEVPR